MYKVEEEEYNMSAKLEFYAWNGYFSGLIEIKKENGKPFMNV